MAFKKWSHMRMKNTMIKTQEELLQDLIEEAHAARSQAEVLQKSFERMIEVGEKLLVEISNAKMAGAGVMESRQSHREDVVYLERETRYTWEEAGSVKSFTKDIEEEL